MQWSGTATAGYRSHEGRVTVSVCDCCRHCSLPFGGSIRRQSATAYGTDHTSGDCRAWPLCVTCPRWTAICEKNRIDAVRDWTQLYRLQLLTSVTWYQRFSYTTICHCHVAHGSSTIPHHSYPPYPHTHVSTDLPENVDLGISYVMLLLCATDSLQTAVSDRAIILIHLLYFNLFCIVYGIVLCQLNNTE